LKESQEKFVREAVIVARKGTMSLREKKFKWEQCGRTFESIRRNTACEHYLTMKFTSFGSTV
jgi:hypothetical protein